MFPILLQQPGTETLVRANGSYKNSGFPDLKFPL